MKTYTKLLGFLVVLLMVLPGSIFGQSGSNHTKVCRTNGNQNKINHCVFISG